MTKILTQCDYDDAIANVKSELSAKGWKDIDESDRDRSYPTHYFSRIRHYFTMCGIDFTIIVDAGATSAYYEGANFDYRASLEVHLPDEQSYIQQQEQLARQAAARRAAWHRFHPSRSRRQTSSDHAVQLTFNFVA